MISTLQDNIFSPKLCHTIHHRLVKYRISTKPSKLRKPAGQVPVLKNPQKNRKTRGLESLTSHEQILANKVAKFGRVGSTILTFYASSVHIHAEKF